MRFFLKSGAYFLLSFLLIFGAIIFYYCHDLPSIEELERKKTKQIIHINYTNLQRLINISNVSDNEIDFFQIPQNLIKAVVLTEDRRFFAHHGIDFFGVMRAYFVNYKAGRIVQGGSTITQQLAKMLFLQPQKTLKRKIQEAILALQLEQYFTKEQILSFYLNRAYFGSGNYGIQQASQEYFNKKVFDLNLEESALLAGILKAPSKISPKNDRNLANERAKLVLKIIKQNTDNENFNFDRSRDFVGQAQFYFRDLILSNYHKLLPTEKNFDEITINSTISDSNQTNLEIIAENFVKEHKKILLANQLAIIVADKKGAIRAMIGGNNYKKNKFNHAFDLTKQAGSMMHNLIYFTALERQIKMDEVYDSKKINFINKKIPQQNHKSTLRQGFIETNFSLAYQLAQKLGAEKISEVMKWFGLEKTIPINEDDLSMGLNYFSLYDLVCVFTTIANDGYLRKPYFIENIIDKDNTILFQQSEILTMPRFFKKNTAYEMKKLLRENVERGNIKNLNFDSNIFAKSGSSLDFKDNWLIGFDDEKIIGIWLGNKNNNSKNFLLDHSLLADLFVRIARNIRL